MFSLKINKTIPEDFDCAGYRKYNLDVDNQSDEWLQWHYLVYGEHEKRVYKVNLPADFNVDDYRLLNTDISQQSNEWLEWHYEMYGRDEGRQYCIYRGVHPVQWSCNTLSVVERVEAWSKDALYKQELPTLIDSNTKNAIITFSSKDRNFLSKENRRYLSWISKQWNAELIIYDHALDILTEDQFKQVCSVKSFRPNILSYICKLLCIRKALNDYDKVLWLDDTCIVSPFAQNIFKVVPNNYIGALVIPFSCGLTESVSDFKYLQAHKNVSISDEYYNTGVMVIPSLYKDIFNFENIITHQDLFQSPYPTQAWLNYLTHVNKCNIFDVTCLYNMMPCCLDYSSVNWNTKDISHLHQNLLKYHIVHFTGFHRNRIEFHNKFFHLHQNTFNENITIVVMNFKRPDNIKNYLLPYYTNIPAVERVIVVHCLADSVFDYVSDKVQHVYEWDTDKTHGVFTRYIAARKYATTKCVLFTDDDVIITAKSMSVIYQKWKEDTNTIVGVEGRKLHKNTLVDEYEYKSFAFYGEVDIVLTSCCMTSIDNVVYACEHEHILRDYTTRTKTIWNGEDIFLCLLNVLHYNKPCYAVQVPMHTLNNTDYAISSSKQHTAERTTLINLFCNRFAFKESSTTIFTTPKYYLDNTINRNVVVRCSEGVGNQLRLFLAGTYLVKNGFINSFTQEWVLNNHNNVNFCDFFVVPIGVEVTNTYHQIPKCETITESTFRQMIQQYAPHIPWKVAILESFKYLHVKPCINDYIETFVANNNINNSVGIHARRTCKTAFLNNGSNTNRVLPITNKLITEICNNHSNIFLATDNRETQEYFKNNINSHVVVAANIPSGHEKHCYDIYSNEQVHRYTTDTHTIFDFLILKQCKMFVGSNESSFSLLVYYWRNNTLDYYIHGKL